MSSFKQINKSDVTHVPYTANKQWDSTVTSYPSSGSYITIYKGTRLTGIFNPITDPVTEGQYERLVYNQINHMFYQNFSGSLLNTSSLANSIFYESASTTYATASQFKYDENPKLIKRIPTGSNQGIRVLAINQDVYGSKVLPYNFVLSSSAYYITDDGNGNLYDQGTVHIGNIFYPQGIAVVTTQSYQNMFALPPLAVSNIYTFKASDLIKTGSTSILANDLVRSGSFITGSTPTGSIRLSGSADQLSTITILSGSLKPSMISGSTPQSFFQQGTYDVYYTVDKALGNGTVITSNKALIRFNIIPPDCTFGFIVATSSLAPL